VERNRTGVGAMLTPRMFQRRIAIVAGVAAALHVQYSVTPSTSSLNVNLPPSFSSFTNLKSLKIWRLLSSLILILKTRLPQIRYSKSVLPRQLGLAKQCCELFDSLARSDLSAISNVIPYGA
jgi:hypothetical protein